MYIFANNIKKHVFFASIIDGILLYSLGKMSACEFFDGADSGEGLPTKFIVPAEEVSSIEKLEKIVTIEIDRSRTRSNHLNKMMRILIQSQKDAQQKSEASYSKLSAEIDKQIASLKDHTPPHCITPPHSPIMSPASSAGSDESTPPDPAIFDTSADSNSNASTPPGPAVIDISPEPHVDQPADDDPEEVKTVPERFAAALKARGIPDDLKVNFEFHPVRGPHLLVTRQSRLAGMAEQRVQDYVSKFAAGLANMMGWSQPVPYTETFTGAPAASNGACDCL